MFLKFRFLPAIILLIIARFEFIQSHASKFLCSRSLSTNQPIMHSNSQSSNSRSIVIKRNGQSLSNGASFVQGETLQVSLSSTSGQYIIEASFGSTGAWGLQGGQCSKKRFYNQDGDFLVPSSRTSAIIIWAGFATDMSNVYITNNFVLNYVPDPTFTPTALPTFAPSTYPTLLPTYTPTIDPTIKNPTFDPTLIPTYDVTAPTPEPTTATPTVNPTTAPSASPTVSPTPQPSVVPTLQPTFLPTAIPTEELATLVPILTTINLENMTINDITSNVEIYLIDSMRLSLKSFYKDPYKIEISNIIDGNSISTTIADNVAVSFEISYMLEGSNYFDPYELYSASIIAISIISNSDVLVNNLHSYEELNGITSTTLHSTTLQDVAYLSTPSPTESPVNDQLKEKMFNFLILVVVFVILLLFFGVRLCTKEYIKYYDAVKDTSRVGSGVNNVIVFISALVSCLFGVISAILISNWTTDSKNEKDFYFLGKPDMIMNSFAYHPLFMTFYFVLQLFAICTWSLTKTYAKVVHVILQTLSLSSLIFALCVIVNLKLDNKSPQLITLHSWLGVFSITVFLFNYSFGGFMAFLTKYYPTHVFRKVFDLSKMHIRIGCVSFILSVGTIHTGIAEHLGKTSCYYLMDNMMTYNEKDVDPSVNYKYLPNSCKIANWLGICLAVATILCITSVSLRKSFPTPIKTNNNEIKVDDLTHEKKLSKNNKVSPK
jgi:hypothetical protein